MIFTFYAFLSFFVNVGFCIFYSFVYCFKKHIPKTKSSVHGSCCLNYKIKVLCSFSGISDKPQFLADVVGSSDRVESPPRPFSQSIMSRNPFPSQVNSFFLLVFPILLFLLEYMFSMYSTLRGPSWLFSTSDSTATIWEGIFVVKIMRESRHLKLMDTEQVPEAFECPAFFWLTNQMWGI